MSFTVATYNVLATAYIRPGWYRRTPPALLEPETRTAALCEHLERRGADLYCLQEVEPPVFEALLRRLGPLGYRGEMALKGLGKPDGCAVFARDSVVRLVRTHCMEYADEDEGRPHSGHVALVLAAEVEGRCLAVVDTHLKWDPRGTPPERQYGYRQIRELLEARPALVPEAEGWIICGDLNVTGESAVIRTLVEAGFQASPPVGAGGPTANPNGRAKRIDWLFHDGALAAKSLPLPVVENETPLPGPGQPSDHVAVVSRVLWRGSSSG